MENLQLKVELTDQRLMRLLHRRYRVEALRMAFPQRMRPTPLKAGLSPLVRESLAVELQIVRRVVFRQAEQEFRARALAVIRKAHRRHKAKYIAAQAPAFIEASTLAAMPAAGGVN